MKRGNGTDKETQEYVINSIEHSLLVFRYAKTSIFAGHLELMENVPGVAAKIANAITAIEWIEARGSKRLAALQKISASKEVA